MELIEKVINAVEPALNDMGYDLVRVSVQGTTLQTLQIMAERKDRRDMTVDDCSRISQTASALLDIADPFAGKWVLEVSSPGIDRPLVKTADYERFAGEQAKIELAHEINGRRRFKGILKGFKDGFVQMDFEGQIIQLPFDDIDKAKLTFPENIFNNKKGVQ